MKKRLLLLTTVILFLATIAVRASYSYFYTENLSSPTWSNWTATPYYTGGTGPSSEYYSPGGYGGITGYGWMMYNTPHWGGGEVSMTYRVATTAGDSFTAYLGSVDTTLATGNYDQVLVALSGGWGSDIQTALVEMVFSDPVAFQAVMQQEATARNATVTAAPAGNPAATSIALTNALQSAVPGLQIFERGKATDVQILAAFQKYKANFTFAGTTLRPR